MQPDFTVLIPCYNEEDAIRGTIDTIHAGLASADAQNYELLIVNDGSSDRSGEILTEIEATDDKLRVIHHERNSGYGAALKTGVRSTHSELIVITDADGTYPLEKIPEMVAMCEHLDMVIGARTADDVSYPLIRKIPKAFLKAYASWLVGQHIPDMNSGQRVFRRSVVQEFLPLLPDTFSFTTTITMAMMRRRYRVKFTEITYKARIGKSKIKPIRDTLRFTQLILRTGLYFGPLRVFMPVAGLLFLGLIVSLVYDVWVIKNLTDKTVLLAATALNVTMFALLADMIDKRSG